MKRRGKEGYHRDKFYGFTKNSQAAEIRCNIYNFTTQIFSCKVVPHTSPGRHAIVESSQNGALRMRWRISVHCEEQRP